MRLKSDGEFLFKTLFPISVSRAGRFFAHKKQKPPEGFGKPFEGFIPASLGTTFS
jgi:hypothetical protein